MFYCRKWSRWCFRRISRISKYSFRNTYEWNDTSTYIKHPPFFNDKNVKTEEDIKEARIIALLGNSVTTDHISPAGAIKEDSPAGQYLSQRQISRKNYNR